MHSVAPTKEQTAAATEKRVNTIETFKARAVALLAEAAELGLERTIAGVEDEKDLSKDHWGMDAGDHDGGLADPPMCRSPPLMRRSRAGTTTSSLASC